MKIYINTDNMPPTIGTTLRTNTVGGLKTYSVVGLASSFNFVRNTSVAMTVIFGGAEIPSIENLTKMVFTVKPAGVFDVPASLIASTSEFKTLEDGTIAAELKFAASSQDFDNALKVNAAGEDDVASAVFQCAFSWQEGTEIYSTASMSVTVYNNVSRDGETPVPPGTEIVMSEIPADLAAQIADLRESKGAIFAAEQSAKQYAAQAKESADAAILDLSGVKEDLNNLKEVVKPATTEKLGTVKIAGSINDTTESHVVSAPLLKSTVAGMAKYFATNSSPTAGNLGIHGKALFASQGGDNGGFYVAGGAGSTISWTQWLTRYQRDKIRVYGKDNGQHEDFYLDIGTDDTKKPLQIARMKDIPSIDPSGLVDIASDQEILGMKTFLGSWLCFAYKREDLQNGSVAMMGTSGEMRFHKVNTEYLATLNLSDLTKNETIAFKSDIPDITGKADADHTHPLLSEFKTLIYSVVQKDGTWVVQTSIAHGINDFDWFCNERPLTANAVANAFEELRKKIAQLEADIKNLQSELRVES